ncbi:hypothetical protein BDW02DRAFT_510396 [Decorospora gaudefroyi]|uniref:Stress-response A/B barrel domain-containing protein n=1 Tax=Decorospora gaudefroyi TaxID=184978 RepID=A0A6A5JYK8_9PLEO|nr:hypothetical protein BDW02DRAFT_510396 [Decorospora gaudefroyi]
MPKIVRLSLFKIPDPEMIKEAIQMYNTLAQDAKKDGKNYIQLAQANATYDDPRSEGYSMLARCIFESKEDMDYYDNQDEAHAKIKAHFKGRVGGPPLVIYSDMQ